MSEVIMSANSEGRFTRYKINVAVTNSTCGGKWQVENSWEARPFGKNRKRRPYKGLIFGVDKKKNSVTKLFRVYCFQNISYIIVLPKKCMTV